MLTCQKISVFFLLKNVKIFWIKGVVQRGVLKYAKKIKVLKLKKLTRYCNIQSPQRFWALCTLFAGIKKCMHKGRSSQQALYAFNLGGKGPLILFYQNFVQSILPLSISLWRCLPIPFLCFFYIFWLFPLSSSSRDPLLILSWAISPPGTSGSGNFIKVWQLSRFAQLRFTKPTAQLLYQSNLKPHQHIHSIATKYIPLPALEIWKTGSFNQRSPNFIHEATVLKPA